MHRLFGVYLLVTAPALLFPHRTASWLLLLAAHLVGAWALFALPPFAMLRERVRTRAPRLVGFLADWYPLLLIPVLYAELVPLNLAVHDGRYFDPLILDIEAWLFGGQPSREWAQAAPFLPLSEVLHGAYLSYYLIIYGPPLILYLSGRLDDFREVVFGVMLTFFAHYLFFVYFPVQGPRYLFPAPDGPIAEGVLYALTHRLLEAGSSQGAAFPSSHVGVSFAQAALAFRFLPRLAPALTILATALAAGAVYGGFHYLTDAVAGLVLGLAMVAITPSLRRRLGRQS